jgi:hypothetical protein
VDTQNTVIGLHDCCGNLRTRPDREGDLGFLSVVNRQSLEEQTTQTRASPTSARVEYQETLKTCAIVGQLSNSIQTDIDDLLPHRVVASSKVVGGVLLSRDQLLWMEQLSICSRPHLIDNGRFKINKHRARNMLPRPRLREECTE